MSLGPCPFSDLFSSVNRREFTRSDSGGSNYATGFELLPSGGTIAVRFLYFLDFEKRRRFARPFSDRAANDLSRSLRCFIETVLVCDRLIMKKEGRALNWHASGDLHQR